MGGSLLEVRILGRIPGGGALYEQLLYPHDPEAGLDGKRVVGDDIEYFHNVKLLSTKMQTWSLLERTVKHIITFMGEQRKTTSNQVVKDILNLLEEEMDQEITLHTVADRLYVNSSYLSRLFKQEMGSSSPPTCWNAKWSGPSRCCRTVSRYTTPPGWSVTAMSVISPRCFASIGA